MTPVMALACIKEPVKAQDVTKVVNKPSACQLIAFNKDFRLESCMPYY